MWCLQVFASSRSKKYQGLRRNSSTPPRTKPQHMNIITREHYQATMWRTAASLLSSRCCAQRHRCLLDATVRWNNISSPPIMAGGFKPILRTFSSQDSNNEADYLCVHVFVSVKPGTEKEFLQASLENARASSQEDGIARFDVIQQIEDETKFMLIEVYKNEDAPAAHKGTNHYAEWRKRVEHMMAEPRKAIKYRNLFPATSAGWDYGKDIVE